MDELFRFSVIRPIQRSMMDRTALPAESGAAAPPVGRIGKGKPAPATTFLAEALAIVASLADDEPPIVIWNRLEPLAVNWLKANGAQIVADPLRSSLETMIANLRALADDDPKQPTIDAKALAGIVGADAKLTAQTAALYVVRLRDLLLALIVVRRAGAAHVDDLVRDSHLFGLMPLLGSSPSLEEVSGWIAAAGLVDDAAASLVPDAAATPSEARAAFAAALEDRLMRTLTIPNALFARLRKPLFGIGFRDFHVVKQQIRSYRKSEIARIENVMAGEERDHLQRHRLSTETDTFASQTTTSETDKELTSTDHTDIKNETQAQVSTDTKVDGAVHAQYDGGSFKIQTDLNVGYDKATSDTAHYASDTAKDVMQKAVSKVTQTITRSQTTKVKESFDELERQRFRNGTGGATRGIYQWLEKVYICQTFSLGRHLLLDMMVPEPAAHLLALATETEAVDPLPVQPHVLGGPARDANGDIETDSDGSVLLGTPLDPLSLDPALRYDPLAHKPINTERYYGTWVGRYNATGVKPPPDETITIGKTLNFDYKDDSNNSAGDTLKVPDGYVATGFTASITGIRNDGKAQDDVWVSIAVGGKTLDGHWPSSQRYGEVPFGYEQLQPPVNGEVTISFESWNVNGAVVAVEVYCGRSDAALDEWKLETYEKLADAHSNLEQAYRTAIQSRRIAGAKVGPLGAADPDQNRLTERMELKRACIAIMSGDNATVGGLSQNSSMDAYPSNATDPPQLPEPRLSGAGLGSFAQTSREVRWFEQAFEWENVAYVLYPYFWGRRSQWTRSLMLRNDDPLFLNFLQAGYARVVVPVRHGFERAMLMYLNIGLPWLGDRAPLLGDPGHNPLYLDVADEIKALTGGGERGENPIPIDEPWEYVLPTTTMYLAPDDEFPSWHRLKPEPGAGDIWGSDAPAGPWSWEIDDPTVQQQQPKT